MICKHCAEAADIQAVVEAKKDTPTWFVLRQMHSHCKGCTCQHRIILPKEPLVNVMTGKGY